VTYNPAMDEPHILVVDDDARLRELLRKYLSENGFRVTVAADAANARDKLAAFAFDLIVLDVMLPGENGLEMTQALRRSSAVPILMLTAMGEPEQRIAGLESGVDDYLPKPFEPRELVLRMRTVLRRVPQPAAERPTVVSLGACVFDPGREELRRRDRVVRLTQGEARLLKFLALGAGVPMSREDLARRMEMVGGGRTIDVQVARLRRKIEDDPKLPRYLQTVRGRGYVLRPD